MIIDAGIANVIYAMNLHGFANIKKYIFVVNVVVKKNLK
jgi:hypothetical protein